MTTSIRITTSCLNQMIDTLNRMTGNPLKPWETVCGGHIALVGCFYLQGAYGGWQVQQIMNDQGGCRSVTEGYKSKREVYNFLRAYMDGIIEGGKVAKREATQMA